MVPSGTPSAAAWLICMDPEANMDTKGQGVGYEQVVPEMKLFGKILEGGLRIVRATNRAPLRWRIRSGAQLRRHAKPGPVGRRTAHVLPTAGKAFYSGLLRDPPMVTEHGFCNGRRREGVFLVAQLLCWRLRRAGRSFAFTFKHMSNAFASGDR
eukprot:2448324-Pyramimonas_sp.AAC.1